MKSSKIIIALLVILVIIILLVLKYCSPETKVTVECDKNESLADAVRESRPRTRINVSGICNEAEPITITQDNIIIDGRKRGPDGGNVKVIGDRNQPVIQVQKGRKNIVIAGLTLTNGKEGLLIEQGGVALVSVNVVDSDTGIQVGEPYDQEELEKIRSQLIEKKEKYQEPATSCTDCKHKSPASKNAWGLHTLTFFREAAAQTSCPSLPATYNCATDLEDIEVVGADRTLVICSSMIETSLVGFDVTGGTVDIMNDVVLTGTGVPNSFGIRTASSVNIRSSSLTIDNHHFGAVINSTGGIIRACGTTTTTVTNTNSFKLATLSGGTISCVPSKDLNIPLPRFPETNPLGGCTFPPPP